MMLKTTTSLAFAAACLTAVATMPAQAQMAGTGGPAPAYNGPQTYQANPPPNWSTSGNYAPQGNMPPSSTEAGGAQVVTNGPQTDQGDMSSSWSARQNVIESERYDRLLESNRGFREARMRKECGPITDPNLHQQCLASFNQDEPYTGSSTPRRHDRSEYGR
jgi:hypothetical protein